MNKMWIYSDNLPSSNQTNALHWELCHPVSSDSALKLEKKKKNWTRLRSRLSIMVTSLGTKVPAWLRSLLWAITITLGINAEDPWLKAEHSVNATCLSSAFLRVQITCYLSTLKKESPSLVAEPLSVLIMIISLSRKKFYFIPTVLWCGLASLLWHISTVWGPFPVLAWISQEGQSYPAEQVSAFHWLQGQWGGTFPLLPPWGPCSFLLLLAS